MNVIQSTVIQLPLDAITLDADLQPRAKIDDATQQDYTSHLAEGGTLPPVLVIYDGDKHYLADGYHRFHAHRALGLVEIAAEVRQGNALDAVVASLRANAEHGKRRVEADYKRAYQIAVNYKLVEPTDSDAVADLMRCSGRWARDLTAGARERERILKDREIQRLKAAGKSNRQVAAEVGVAESTVRNRATAQKRKSSVSAHPIEADPDDPRQMHIDDVLNAQTAAATARANLARLETPEAKAWHAMLEALRQVNALPTPTALFRNRYRGFDRAIADELRQARDWINEMHMRFFNV